MSSKGKDSKRRKRSTQHKLLRTQALKEIGFKSMAELAKAAMVNQGDLSNISKGKRKPCDGVADKLIRTIHERNYQEGWSYMDAAFHFQEAFNFLRGHFATESGKIVDLLDDSDVDRWHQNHLNELVQLQQKFDAPLSAASCNGSAKESLTHLISFLKSWEMKHDFGYLGKVKQAFASSRSLLIRPAIVKGMQEDGCYALVKETYTEIRHIAHLCGAFELVREMSEWLILKAIAHNDILTEVQAKVTKAWMLTSRNTSDSLFEAQKLVQDITHLVHSTVFLEVISTEHMDVLALFAELRLRLAIRLDQQRVRPLGNAKFEKLLEKSNLLLIQPTSFEALSPRMKTRYSIPLAYQHGVYLHSLKEYEGAREKFEAIAQKANYIGWTRVEQAAYSWLATLFEEMGDKERCVEVLDKIDALYLQKRQRISRHIRSRLMGDE